MENQRQLIVLWCVIVVAWNPVTRATEPPEATPTPRPGSLAAFAASTSLHRAPETDGTDAIVISNDNLSNLADGAVVTVVSGTTATLEPVEIRRRIDQKVREKWRKQVLTQQDRISALETKKAAVEAEINRLERGSLNSRALDRIERAEAKLRSVEKEIVAAKQTLSRIVHEARKEGAKPGWFR